MKIIGDTGGGYLVEISDYELEQIIGTKVPNRSHYAAFQPGKKIEVSNAWKKLEPIIDGEKRIKQQADILRGLANVLDGTAELVKRTMEIIQPASTKASSEPA